MSSKLADIGPILEKYPLKSKLQAFSYIYGLIYRRGVIFRRKNTSICNR